ncbi:MAG: threonylcarbamoyl-AMP synthase [Clostridia bacterium]|nr:threonylcarbamoyl-AMP synthase [Clostridia bacterium]
MVKRYKQTEIDELVKILKNDGVVSVPTDTVYGICARISTQKAHDKLVTVKNRSEEKSFPVMCANIEQIKSIAIVNKTAEKIIKAFMPGPLTVVLKKNNEMPNYVTNGKDTIAVRIATSDVLKEIIEKVESPLFMTSANISGKPTCNSLDEIENACPLLDGMLEGKVIFSKGSTIIDCTSNEIMILRSGPISREEILEALNK